MANNNKHAGPNVPALRFPEFSGEWIESKLGDIADFSKGAGISKDQRSEKGNPCILYGELYTRYKSEVITNVFSKTALPDSNLVKSKANDIIIPASGETAEDIATARCVPFDNILLGGDLNIIRLHEQDGKFFSYQLNGVRKYDIATVAQGVSVVHLHAGDLKGITVKYPSHIAEQEKISQILGLIDDRIATQSKIIEELTTLRSALIEKCAKQTGNYFSLSDILEEVEERSTTANQYQVLSSTVKGIFSQKEYFNKDIASEDNKGYKVVRKGHIVLSPQNLWMGNINYNDRFDIGIVSPSYKVFSIKEGFNPTFIAALLQTKKALNEYMLASEQGASIVRRNLNIEAFMAIKFRIPDARQQDSLSLAITAINAKLNNERCYLEQLTMQKSCLLENMFI